MRISKGQLVYALLMNAPVSFCITLSASLMSCGLNIDWINFLINYAISYPIAVSISLLIPLVKIGKWFTRLFHVKDDTYTDNIGYRLLANLIITLIYFFGISPLLGVINYFLLGMTDPVEAVINFFRNGPVILIVGYFASLGTDFVVYRIAKKADPTFD